MATILIIFPKINSPNCQILCSLYVCLCFVWRSGGAGPPASFPLPFSPWLCHCILSQLFYYDFFQYNSGSLPLLCTVADEEEVENEGTRAEGGAVAHSSSVSEITFDKSLPRTHAVSVCCS